MDEKIINVPLTEAAKSWLEARAARNLRAVGREAQAIIEAARKRDSRSR